jgi:hypothetical protein
MTMDEEARRKNLRSRNIALALALFCFVILFYVVTLVKGVPSLQRPL